MNEFVRIYERVWEASWVPVPVGVWSEAAAVWVAVWAAVWAAVWDSEGGCIFSPNLVVILLRGSGSSPLGPAGGELWRLSRTGFLPPLGRPPPRFPVPAFGTVFFFLGGRPAFLLEAMLPSGRLPLFWGMTWMAWLGPRASTLLLLPLGPATWMASTVVVEVSTCGSSEKKPSLIARASWAEALQTNEKYIFEIFHFENPFHWHASNLEKE